MSYPECVQRAVAYMEAHLDEPVRLAEVACAAAFSPYHFHRIFQALTGESVGEYLRRRRLARAARELLGSRRRIIEVALAHQFESQASFTKAFHRLYGVTPAAYRRAGRPLVLKEKPPLTPRQLAHIQGVQPAIVAEPGFSVVGLLYEGRNQEGEIPACWSEFARRVTEVPHRSGDGVMIGLCEPEPLLTDESHISYLCGVPVAQVGPLPPGMVGRTVPARRYAVFTHPGSPATLDLTYGYIFGTWLPGTSEYELAWAPDFERYAPDGTVTVHMPIDAKGPVL